MIDKAMIAAMKRERKDLEDTYRVDANGIVRAPGKFEGEGIWVVYFWNAALDGGADVDDPSTGIMTFRLTPEERAAFPELKGRKTLRIYEGSDGFVVEVRS